MKPTESRIEQHPEKIEIGQCIGIIEWAQPRSGIRSRVRSMGGAQSKPIVPRNQPSERIARKVQLASDLVDQWANRRRSP